MALNLSEQAQEQAILQAVGMAGAGADDSAVSRELWRTLRFLDSDSPMRKKLGEVQQFKTVLGTVIGVDREVTSKRGLVYIKSAQTHPKWNPQGQEYARSDFLSNKGARDLMNQAKGLKGHKVAATLLVLETENGKAREIVLLDDLGVDPAFDEDNAEYQANHSYLKLDTSKLASHGAK